MSKLIIIVILLLSFNNLNAQTDEQIINQILYELFGLQQDTILIVSSISKTYFEYDSVSLENMTGLTLPSLIISEWKNNELNQEFKSAWNEHELNKIDTEHFEHETIISKKPDFRCLSKAEIDLLFEKTIQRQKVYSVSKLLFDNLHENAVFQVTEITGPGEFYSQTILIKKIFGRWKIIERFDFIIS